MPPLTEVAQPFLIVRQVKYDVCVCVWVWEVGESEGSYSSSCCTRCERICRLILMTSCIIISSVVHVTLDVDRGSVYVCEGV